MSPTAHKCALCGHTRADHGPISMNAHPFVEPETVTMPCLCCGKTYKFSLDSNEANGVFNVFCENGECEDRYAARL